MGLIESNMSLIGSLKIWKAATSGIAEVVLLVTLIKGICCQ